MKRQTGFTLIELVIVILILGILAAVAAPRFVDLEDDANAVALTANAATMNSAMSINYAGCAARNHAAAAGECVTISNCTDVEDILVAGLPDGYTVGAVALGANGNSGTCTVTQTATGDDEDFTGISAGN